LAAHAVVAVIPFRVTRELDRLVLIRLLFPVTRIVIPVIAIMTAIVIMEEGPIAVVIIPVADVEPDEGNRPRT